MSLDAQERLFRFLLTETDDPEAKAQQRRVAKAYLNLIPEVKAEVEAEIKAEMEARMKPGMTAHEEAQMKAELLEEVATNARLDYARSELRRELARHNLALSAEEQTRIDGCAKSETLWRWYKQAMDAKSAAEALQ